MLKDGADITSEGLQKELVTMVREAVGPIANFKRILIVERLPKTRSGKILRQVMRKMIDGEVYVVPSTIEDRSVIEELETGIANWKL